MPGDVSQGWPGLIFLSSVAFLNPQELTDLKLDPVSRILDSQTLVHETAHQWWGDLVLWKSYRDQWLMEGLANYSALLVLEKRDPAQFRQVLEKYRRDLQSTNKDGERLSDAGPVTLGQRLISSHFPGGYEAITYERGAWLFHMLRSMLRDCELTTRDQTRQTNPDEPFFRALRRIRDRYAGTSITTKEFLHVFEEELPRPLWYENRHSLDWFMDGWINGKAMPILQAREIRILQKDQSAIASGVIVQKDARVDLVTAVPVYAVTAAKSLVYIGEVLADGAETSFRLPTPTDTRKIVLDPKQTILTTLK
jgi:aminopeptidase N